MKCSLKTLAIIFLLVANTHLCAGPCDHILTFLKPAVFKTRESILQRTTAKNRDEMAKTLLDVVKREAYDDSLSAEDGLVLPNAIKYFELLGVAPQIYQPVMHRLIDKQFQNLLEVQTGENGGALEPYLGEEIDSSDGIVEARAARAQLVREQKEQSALLAELAETPEGKKLIATYQLAEIKNRLLQQSTVPEVPSAMGPSIAKSLDRGMRFAFELGDPRLARELITKNLQFGRYLPVAFATAIANHDEFLLDLGKSVLADALVPSSRGVVLDAPHLRLAISIFSSVDRGPEFKAEAKKILGELFRGLVRIDHPNLIELAQRAVHFIADSSQRQWFIQGRGRYLQNFWRSNVLKSIDWDVFLQFEQIRKEVYLSNRATNPDYENESFKADFADLFRILPVGQAPDYYRQVGERMREVAHPSLAFQLQMIAAIVEEFRH